MILAMSKPSLKGSFNTCCMKENNIEVVELAFFKGFEWEMIKCNALVEPRGL